MARKLRCHRGRTKPSFTIHVVWRNIQIPAVGSTYCIPHLNTRLDLIRKFSSMTSLEQKKRPHYWKHVLTSFSKKQQTSKQWSNSSKSRELPQRPGLEKVTSEQMQSSSRSKGFKASLTHWHKTPHQFPLLRFRGLETASMVSFADWTVGLGQFFIAHD